MAAEIYAYNSIYNLLNISRKDLSRDLNRSSESPASIATSMLFGTSLTPTYRQLINYDNYNSQASVYSDFKNAMLRLKDTSSRLTDSSTAARQATSESEAIDVTVQDDATLGNFQIEVEQMAKKQTNQTDFIAKDLDLQLDASFNHLEIINEGKSTDLLIDRSGDETTQELFETIANAIKDAELGIDVSLMENESGQLSLSLTSKDTGEQTPFEVSGNLADALKLSEPDQVAQNAVLRVNDAIVTSTSNLVELDGGKVGIKINSESTIPFDLYINVSGSGALSSAKTFANRFNEAMTYLQGLGNVQSELLTRQFTSAVREALPELETLGITIGNDNNISIDEKVFAQKYESDEPEVKEALRKLESTAKKVDSRAEQALKMPLDHLYSNTSSSKRSGFYNISYTQNRMPVNLNSLYAKGSIIDVLF